MGSRRKALPVYDAHGNDVASLSRNGSGGFSLGDRRTYDAWGVVRSQQSGGDPKLRYCASLGHKQDDESGLVYMRARYYEATSGRFISADTDRRDGNWFVYARNNPVNLIDQSGKDAKDWTVIGTLLFTGAVLVAFLSGPSISATASAASVFMASMAVAAFCCAFNDLPTVTGLFGPEGGNLISMVTAAYAGTIALILTATKAGLETSAWAATLACASYSAILLGCLVASDIDSGWPQD